MCMSNGYLAADKTQRPDSMLNRTDMKSDALNSYIYDTGVLKHPFAPAPRH